MGRKIEFDEYGVPTIKLGDGKTRICSVYHPDYVGICFSDNPDGSVGVSDIDLVRGQSPKQLDSFLQITTANLASLDVLIQELKNARGFLIDGGTEHTKGEG
jgi:hypothetical protein